MSQFCITYRVDKENKIFFLSDEWQPFADENKANHLTADSVLNKSLFDFVTNGKCQFIYQMLLERSRKGQEILQFPFRCDSPEKRRFMLMEMIPLKDESTEFKSFIVREEAREPVSLLDKFIDRSDDILTICSWCKKVKIDEDKWVEVEMAIKQLGLFDAITLPLLSHGMCSRCYENARIGFID